MTDRTELSIRIIQEIANVEGVEPAHLRPPLHNSIDPVALDRLFSNKGNPQHTQRSQVEFAYKDYWITVTDSETITIEKMEADGGIERTGTTK